MENAIFKRIFLLLSYSLRIVDVLKCRELSCSSHKAGSVFHVTLWSERIWFSVGILEGNKEKEKNDKEKKRKGTEKRILTFKNRPEKSPIREGKPLKVDLTLSCCHIPRVEGKSRQARTYWSSIISHSDQKVVLVSLFLRSSYRSSFTRSTGFNRVKLIRKSISAFFGTKKEDDRWNKENPSLVHICVYSRWEDLINWPVESDHVTEWRRRWKHSPVHHTHITTTTTSDTLHG